MSQPSQAVAKHPLSDGPSEGKSRPSGTFRRVESQLSVHSIPSQKSFLISWTEYFASFLGWANPQAKPADPGDHTVWLFDNTAFRPGTRLRLGSQELWVAEVVAAVFEKNSREDLGKVIALVADLIGLDGQAGHDPIVRKRMAERLQPFISEVAPARSINLEVPLTATNLHKYKLNPSNQHGIISHAININSSVPILDGTSLQPRLGNWPDLVTMNSTFAAPGGWLVISDIDDTIKYTMTPDAIGILRTTFAEEAKPIHNMPELYAYIQEKLLPTWFYLSASPYNLYPFLHTFIQQYFPKGTMILRDSSWQSLAGLLKSFTQGTQAYKVDRMRKIHGWFPKRKILCIGDSTQRDPEAYAEMYQKHSQWIKAIFIRKVTGLPHMDEQNSPERFEEAFKNVPKTVWKVFEEPEELNESIDELRARFP
ncbi:hypothetical protein LOZ57_002205 [Ophidiomyces ophidiicola]|uniref:uncharacterized protein n=1 Tax=Ophidiomyces ophidiicola TaxID=1387563 RepID=UPI0020C388C4|nr:uncharacterized protein LOZ57_002205 [Ophidiomyces ophidiicola]KAI1949730.1 hypothetical protein LOZ57_002205 [Ophidiomyces ophidiicola]KAI2058927.1 hypothetical protein LOZ43_002379 [Ophidiomyces ophidiicola]